MNQKFAIKKISCDNYASIFPKIEEAELDWLKSLLIRIKVPQIMIDKALMAEDYSKSAWRDYLFENYGIIIIKHLVKQKVTITKINTQTSEKMVLGEWLKPEIVKIKGLEKTSFEVNLKYWQIV